jgi:hypothetical protein
MLQKHSGTIRFCKQVHTQSSCNERAAFVRALHVICVIPSLQHPVIALAAKKLVSAAVNFLKAYFLKIANFLKIAFFSKIEYVSKIAYL